MLRPSAVRADVPVPSPARDTYRPGAPLLSPLRYPGAKRRLVGYVADILIANDLAPSLFVEPFAGGASVSLQLLSDGIVESVGLIDRDPRIASFWRTVLHDTEWLVEQVRSVPLDLGHWRSFRSTPGRSDRDRALACLYLNRTSFSGIIADRAGPLGGTRGDFNEQAFGCRFPRATLEKRIRAIAALRDLVAFVWNLDWNQGLGRIREMQSRGRLPRNAFYYLDPPFFEKADRLYTYCFAERDHERLRDVLVGMTPDQDPWILSYDSLPRVNTLYGESASRVVTVQRFYTTSRLTSGHPMFAEAVVTNLPECPRPRTLSRR